MKPFRCECGRKFGSMKAWEQHKAMSYAHNPNATVTKIARPQREETFADRAIAAELDRAMGIYNPDQDWLLS